MPKKILVIDDDEGILAAFEAMLTGEGYSVETSSTVYPLLSLTKDNTPDLVLLDVLLSGADGRDICKQLKHQSFTKHIPIIMVSAALNMEKSVMESSADDFITKPFEINDLLDKVKKYIITVAE